MAVPYYRAEQQIQLLHDFRRNTMKVGLALSGGGARGFAQAGVIKVLLENAVPIHAIAGTSAGSIFGAAVAAGMSADDIYAMSRRVGWMALTRPAFSPRGVLSNAPMGAFLEMELGVKRIEDLAIPYAAVAYDLTAGREVVFKDEGDLIFAIRSSCSVPGVFEPLKDSNGHLIVDGGITSVLPVEAVRSLGADVVIAIDILSSGEGFRSPRTAAGTMILAAMALIRHTAQSQRELADVAVIPAIGHIRPDQMGKREELFRLGEDAGLAALSEIRAAIG